MRLAFYISSLSSGGAERVLVTLANQFAKLGNDVHVVSLEKRKKFYEVDEKVHLHRLKHINKRSNILWDYYYIKKSAKDINADYNISFLCRCNILLLLTNLLNDKKIIVSDRNNPRKEHSWFVFKVCNLLYRRANRIIVQTNEAKHYYPKEIQKKISIIENPIDAESLYKKIKNKEIYKENTIISIGRLEPQKDYKTLIRAYKKFCDHNVNWKLKIFGSGYMEDEIQTLIQKLNIEEMVTLCKPTPNIFFELNKAKIFVLSSLYEGFPNALCEAMEAGLICISSNCSCGPKELINHGINGFLFNVGDEKALEELLDKCVEFEEKNEVGIQAKRTVKRLHLKYIMEEWEKVFSIIE